MNHLVCVTGDMNDGDDNTKVSLLDFTANPFKGWRGIEHLTLTWENIITSFSKALKDYKIKKDKEKNWYHNWGEDGGEEDIYLLMLENLSFPLGLTISHIQELIFDLVPNSEYTIHSINSVDVYITTEKIVYF